MKNATLLLDSVPAYTISTELRVTGTGELLARVAWKDILPDTITFPTVNGGREMGLKKWLNKSKLSDGSSIHVIGTKTGNFALKTHPVHRLAAIQLFHEDDLQTPVGHWQRTSSTSPPTLVLQAGIRAASRPKIITAFIVREFKMRMKEQTNQLAHGRPAGQFLLLAATK
ncbi:hypothetical protein B0H13DRAFT_2273515 [Mycena leptocephala]|nr:hypothetical protein B0H13DRAFT_2273515 [Mycena leptocephala]